MTRVEWAALSGDDVEAVLANLIYNRHGRALRIRPSRGDHGIDVIVPTGATRDPWDIYQIKKFALNLTASQKTQIKKSFQRVLVALVRQDTRINNWYLVMPLNPTLENLAWFRTMPGEAVDELAADTALGLTGFELAAIRGWLGDPSRVIEWKGLEVCQDFAADYWYVIDYYLHGGRERLANAVADLGLLLQRDRALSDAAAADPNRGVALLEPADIQEHLARLDRVLNTDPHYHYAFSIEPRCPDLRPEPDLVAARQLPLAGGRWLTFRIYQRSAQSTEERPIPIEFEFDFSDTPTEKEAYLHWLRFGRPTEVTATVTVGLPGGLGLDRELSRVELQPAGEPFRSRLRVANPDGDTGTEVALTMTAATGVDQTGAWAHGVDDSGILHTEWLRDRTAGTLAVTFTIGPLEDVVAARALSAITLASRLAAPGILQFGREYGPFTDVMPFTGSEPPVNPALAQFVRALATIQTRISAPLLIPDLSTLTDEQLTAIRRAATLIDGRTIVGTWRDLRLETTSAIELNEAPGFPFTTISALSVSIGGAEHVLGSVQLRALSAEVASIDADHVRLVPHRDNTMHQTFLPEVLPAAHP